MLRLTVRCVDEREEFWSCGVHVTTETTDQLVEARPNREIVS